MDTPEKYNMYTTLACQNDTMTLSCPTGRNISLTKAHWGHYYLACSDCCAPNPAYDCTVDMETVEEDWFDYIKSQCDGIQSCNIDHIAYMANECEIEYYADYMQTFYDCLPIDTTEPIGFSAKRNNDIRLYPYELVPFNDVLSNFGGHYSTETYSFTCPVRGVYIFSMAINQYSNSNLQAYLYRNNDELIRSYANGVGYRDSASATVITECNVGDQVFVMVWNGGYFDGSGSQCHFTGYLLDQL